MTRSQVIDGSRAVLLALALSAVGGAAAAGVYKWTDADGEVHFSDQPPPDVAAEVVRPQTASDPHTAERLDEMKSRADAIFEQRREAAAKAAEEKEKAQKVAEHCRSLRDKLEKLRISTRNQRVNAQGELEFIDEDTRQQWIREAEAEIAKHCK